MVFETSQMFGKSAPPVRAKFAFCRGETAGLLVAKRRRAIVTVERDAAVKTDFHVDYDAFNVDYDAEDDACSGCGAVSWGMTPTGHAECVKCGRVESA